MLGHLLCKLASSASTRHVESNGARYFIALLFFDSKIAAGSNVPTSLYVGLNFLSNA